LLSFGDKSISSEKGLQQGDPLGPTLFCLPIQPLISTLESELNVWFLDDGTLGGDLKNTCLSDLKKVITLGAEVGLQLNASKCEIFCLEENVYQRNQKINL